MDMLEETQKSLFDLTGKEFNINWVDDKQPLFIANNPLHWKGHKLQILIARLERQAQNNAAQFNSNTYYQAVNELEKIMTAINKGGTDGVLGSGDMGEVGDADPTSTVGAGVAPSLDFGISADNPLTR